MSNDNGAVVLAVAPLARDHRLDAELHEVRIDPCRSVALVPGKRLVRADEQRIEHRRVVRLACAQLEVKRVAATVTQNVNFRAPPTSGAPQSVIVGFVGVGIFFPRRRCSVQPGSMCHRYTTVHRAAHRRVRRAPASGTACSRTFRRPPIDRKSSRPSSTVRTPSGCRATARLYEAPRTSRRAVRDDLEVADLS